MPRQQAPLSFEYVLLGIIADQPTHGYEIYKAISRMQGIGLIWSIKQSQLYALLDKLENSGLISARVIPGDTHPNRKEYTLTETGRILFQGWVKSPVMHGRDMRQDFLARLYFAIPQGRPAVQALVAQQRQTCLEWLELDLRLLRRLSPHQVYESLVYRFRIHQTEAMLAWLDECASVIP